MRDRDAVRRPAAPGAAAGARRRARRAILPALQRSPCLVSFSGGRDSSAVLAAAAAIARREGLPAPVPATVRAPGAAESDEAAWQEQVVAHVGIADWVRLEVHDELDVIGPHARACCARTGCCGRATCTSTCRCSSSPAAARC